MTTQQHVQPRKCHTCTGERAEHADCRPRLLVGRAFLHWQYSCPMNTTGCGASPPSPFDGDCLNASDRMACSCASNCRGLNLVLCLHAWPGLQGESCCDGTGVTLVRTIAVFFWSRCVLDVVAVRVCVDAWVVLGQPSSFVQPHMTCENRNHETGIWLPVLRQR